MLRPIVGICLVQHTELGQPWVGVAMDGLFSDIFMKATNTVVISKE